MQETKSNEIMLPYVNEELLSLIKRADNNTNAVKEGLGFLLNETNFDLEPGWDPICKQMNYIHSISLFFSMCMYPLDKKKTAWINNRNLIEKVLERANSLLMGFCGVDRYDATPCFGRCEFHYDYDPNLDEQLIDVFFHTFNSLFGNHFNRDLFALKILNSTKANICRLLDLGEDSIIEELSYSKEYICKYYGKDCSFSYHTLAYEFFLQESEEANYYKQALKIQDELRATIMDLYYYDEDNKKKLEFLNKSIACFGIAIWWRV